MYFPLEKEFVRFCMPLTLSRDQLFLTHVCWFELFDVEISRTFDNHFVLKLKDITNGDSLFLLVMCWSYFLTLSSGRRQFFNTAAIFVRLLLIDITLLIILTPAWISESLQKSMKLKLLDYRAFLQLLKDRMKNFTDMFLMSYKWLSERYGL